MTLEDAARILAASFAAIPTLTDLEHLQADAIEAERKGYYDPVEDERLREVYANFLGVRVAIWQMIRALSPQFYTPADPQSPLPKEARIAFGLAFCGAEILVRTGEYLIELARKRPIIRKKLDEAEPRYGIRRKSFTRLFRGLTSWRRMRWFYQSRDYFDGQRDVILTSLGQAGFDDIAVILQELNLPSAARGDHLKRYMGFVKFSLRRRRRSAHDKMMFTLFEQTGSDIADLKIPLVKLPGEGKRITPDILAAITPLLQPGDVFITRHDDALSNLFLPGFWPHAALYIGNPESRAAMDLPDVSDGFRRSGDAVNFLESKKDGVLLRPAEETLAVDACVVLRPKLPAADMQKALSRGLTHAGKLYDFVFDFTSSERLACTELIYRSYHGIGPVHFNLSTRAGRKCLSAEDILNQGLSNDWFEIVLICNVGGQGLVSGPQARTILTESFEASFS